MFIRYQYYEAYATMLDGELLQELKKDIQKDYDKDILGYSQYSRLIKMIDKRIKKETFIIKRTGENI